jgi:hypothetical protein
MPLSSRHHLSDWQGHGPKVVGGEFGVLVRGSWVGVPEQIGDCLERLPLAHHVDSERMTKKAGTSMVTRNPSLFQVVSNDVARAARSHRRVGRVDVDEDLTMRGLWPPVPQVVVDRLADFDTEGERQRTSVLGATDVNGVSTPIDIRQAELSDLTRSKAVRHEELENCQVAPTSTGCDVHHREHPLDRVPRQGAWDALESIVPRFNDGGPEFLTVGGPEMAPLG